MLVRCWQDLVLVKYEALLITSWKQVGKMLSGDIVEKMLIWYVVAHNILVVGRTLRGCCVGIVWRICWFDILLLTFQLNWCWSAHWQDAPKKPPTQIIWDPISQESTQSTKRATGMPRGRLTLLNFPSAALAVYANAAKGNRGIGTIFEDVRKIKTASQNEVEGQE